MGIRAEQKEKRRQDILDTALHLFVHKGYAGTSVRDIAGVLEISPSLLFHYFGTKEEILAELMKTAMFGVSSATGLFSAQKSAVDSFEDIVRLIFGSFSVVPQSAPLFLLVHQVATSDSVPSGVKAIIAQNPAVEMTVSAILAGQRQGTIREGDPVTLAIAYWGAIQGIAEMIAIDPQCPVPDPAWVTAILKKP